MIRTKPKKCVAVQSVHGGVRPDTFNIAAQKFEIWEILT